MWVFSRSSGIASSFALAVGIAVLMCLLNAGDPKFFLEPNHLSMTIGVNGIILFLFFSERLRRWLPLILATLLIVSNSGINPIMRGLRPLVDSPAYREITRLHAIDPGGKWVVYHDRFVAQLVKATGTPIFNGTKAVPDLPLLHQLDPDPAEHDYIYNRYANIGCELPRDNEDDTRANLLEPDFYVWVIPPDHPVLQAAGYRYVLFPSAWPGASFYGFSLVKRIEPGNLWVYRFKKLLVGAP